MRALDDMKHNRPVSVLMHAILIQLRIFAIRFVCVGAASHYGYAST